MIVLDVNVLIAAFREDHAHHILARPWLINIFAAESAVVIPDFVWVGFVRIVTNSHIFEVPSTLDEAFGFVAALTESPAYRSVPGIAGGLRLFEDVSREAGASANLVSDAYIAAVARSLACPVGSFDRDFRRFTGVELVMPG
ncbi:TA system VapC family ribonuclease toxin [Subtercola endophyticus]|uniref:TA system VapC family ribonuclease toxin n=1 Tax=Subtercola endophyticus TaxID=2895559 RepID=UPI001E429054|nr:TA system VapC family ribonuclease toxin [Subtercola endophyticus]UFS58847.1 PIN domain-containing protein [Subtercola endophyticus]